MSTRSSRAAARRLLRSTVLAGFLASQLVPTALAQPSGGTIVGGQGSISQNNRLTQIDQTSDRLIIDWQSFDTINGDVVRFIQPSREAMALNRVLSGQATRFDGSLFANGNVVIVNGAGIHFGANAAIDVGGLIASSADISNTNFLNGNLIFDQAGQPDAMVTNAGSITVNDAGLAALVAPGVENSGFIRADLGTAILGAGETHTIDFRGDGLISFALTSPTTATPRNADGEEAEALVENSGTVQADGGSVVMTASQASRVLDRAINMSGVAQANSVGVRNGRIVLGGGSAGRVRVSGTVRSQGTRAGESGGTVHVTGEEIETRGAEIYASGVDRAGDVLLGGAERGQSLTPASEIGYLLTGDVLAVVLGDGAGATDSGFMPLAARTTVDADTNIDASSSEGNGGRVIVWGRDEVNFLGHINTLGGDNGFVEVSTFGSGAIAGQAQTGHFLVDPGDVCITTGGSTANCATGAVPVSGTSIENTLNGGGMVEINTDARGTNGTGRVDFGGSGSITVNNNTGMLGDFIIHAADTIDTQDVVFASIGSTGTNYDWNAGSSLTLDPQSTANIFLRALNLDSGGGKLDFNAADSIFATSQSRVRSSGGNFSMSAGANIFVDGTLESIGGTMGFQTGNDFVVDSFPAPSFGLINSGSGDITISAESDFFTVGHIQSDGGKIIVDAGDEVDVFGSIQSSGGSIHLQTRGELTVETQSFSVFDASVVSNGGNVSLVSDRMTLPGEINAGSGDVTIQSFRPDQLIDLGGIDPFTGSESIGVLDLLTADIAGIIADTLRIGSSNAGDIIISDAIALTNVNTLSLITGGDIADSSPSVGIEYLTANRLALTVGGSARLSLDVSELAFQTGGQIELFNRNSFAVTEVDGLLSSFANNAGVSATPSPSSLTVFGGSISIQTDIDVENGSLSLFGGSPSNVGIMTDPGVTLSANSMLLQGNRGIEIGAGTTFDGQFINLRSMGGSISIAEGAVFNNPSSDLGRFELNARETVFLRDIIADQSEGSFEAESGIGSIFLSGNSRFYDLEFEQGGVVLEGSIEVENSAILGTPISLSGDARIFSDLDASMEFGSAIDGAFDLAVDTMGTVEFRDGAIVGGATPLTDLTVHGDRIEIGNSPITVNGDISFVADAMEIESALNGGSNTVSLTPKTVGQVIDLGGDDIAGTLGLSAAEIASITADTLRIGGSNTGDITISDAIALPNVDMLSLTTGRSITSTNTSGADIAVENLSLTAGAGIGGIAPLTTSVSNLALAFTTGPTSIANDRDLTIANVDNNPLSQVFGTTNLSVSGTLTFATSLGSYGDMVLTADTLTVTDTGRIRTFAPASLFVDAATVNLYDDIQADGGLSGTAATVNVFGPVAGSPGRDGQIQDAIDVATGGAFINLSAGLFDGFIVNKADLTISGAGRDTIINATSPAATVSANNATVQSMLLQGTGTTGQVGLLLDGIAAPNLTGVQIIDVDFANLDDGIRSQGDIGDGVASNVDVTIRGNNSGNRAIFEDFLNEAIDVGDADGDAVYLIRDIVVADGDGDGFSTGEQPLPPSGNNGDGLRFGAIGGATIERADISQTRRHGLFFGTDLSGASIRVLDSSISTFRNDTRIGDGVRVSALDGGSFHLENNSLIEGRSAVFFAGPITNGAGVLVDRSEELNSRFAGIQFGGSIEDAEIRLSRNWFTETNVHGIHFDPAGPQGINLIDDALVRIDGGTFIDGGITGNGINVLARVTGDTQFSIVDTQIGTDTNRVAGDGIFFDNALLDSATVLLDFNTIYADEHAVEFGVVATPSTLSIVSGTYDGTGGALLVDNSGTTPDPGNPNAVGRLLLGDAQYFAGAGATVIDLITDDTGVGLNVDFSGSAQVTDGETGLRMSGPGINVLNDDLGTITFSGQDGPYITLADGAEFEPGTPTVLDATEVLFDGSRVGDMSFAAAVTLEEKLTHYLDDPTLGLINTGRLVVPDASSIQLAVNAAGVLGGPQMVFVGPGTFGGSVEVWVDNLTLVGQGASTIIDTDAVDPFANNDDVDNGFLIAAIDTGNPTDPSGTGDVTGVTIEGFSFLSNTAGIGIELGAGAASVARDTLVRNSTFDGLSVGILADAIADQTRISSVEASNIDTSAVLVDSVLRTGDVVEIDGSDLSAADGTIRFAERIVGGDVVISDNAIEATAGDAVRFEGPVRNNADIALQGNRRIAGADSGVVFEDVIRNAAIDIEDNFSISGVSSDAIRFEGVVRSGSEVSVARNAFVLGRDDGLVFERAIRLSSVSIDQNGLVAGARDDGIDFQGPVRGNADITIQRNGAITGLDHAIVFDGLIHNADVAIDRNFAIRSTGGDAVAFNDRVRRGAEVAIERNFSIRGADSGIVFDDPVRNSTIEIALNGRILGETGDGVRFEGPLRRSTTSIDRNFSIVGGDDGLNIDRIVEGSFSLAGNTSVRGRNGSGVEFEGPIRDVTSLTIEDNERIIGGEEAIEFDTPASIDNSSVAITGNSLRAGTDGIFFDGLITDSDIDILDNVIDAGRDGVHVANLGGNTSVSIGASFVLGVENGLRVFGSEESKTDGDTSTLSLETSAFEGETGAGISVTTFFGGTGITTAFGPDVETTGSPALAMSGPNQSIANNDIGSVTFNSVAGGDFIVLSNTALFDPDRPTVIPGIGAVFDGETVGPDGPQALIDRLELRIVDFDDDATLGQIFLRDEPEVTADPPFFPGLTLDRGRVRVTNIQTPGDWMLRPDFFFQILATNPLLEDYPLGTCLFEGIDPAGTAIPLCINPAGQPDPSPSILRYLEGLEQLSMVQQ